MRFRGDWASSVKPNPFCASPSQEDAKQILKRERGFSSGRHSTYTNAMRIADTAKVMAAWKEALNVEALNVDVNMEVKFATMPIPKGVGKGLGKGRTGALSSTPR